MLISESFLYSVAVDFTVDFVVWFGVGGTLFLIHCVNLAQGSPTRIGPWMSSEMRLYMHVLLDS